MIFVVAFFTPFFLALLFTPIVMHIAHRGNIVDKPSGIRKLHQKTVPLLGGTAIFFAFFLTVFGLWHFGVLINGTVTAQTLLAIFLGGMIIMIGGALDDIFNLPPAHQLFFSLLALIIVLFGGIRIIFITNPFGGVIDIPFVMGEILTFLWIFGMMYTTKFLDGLDGLVTGISVIASLVIFVVSLFWDKEFSGTSLLSLALAGACLGFLFYNFHPAKIFLGDGGSVFLGFMLGILSVLTGSKIATAFLVMGLPIVDAFWVIYRRIKQGKSPMIGDRKHFHFKLLDSGMSHRKTVLFLYAISCIFGVSALFLNSKGKVIAIIVLVVTASLLIQLVYFKRKIRRFFHSSRNGL